MNLPWLGLNLSPISLVCLVLVNPTLRARNQRSDSGRNLPFAAMAGLSGSRDLARGLVGAFGTGALDYYVAATGDDKSGDGSASKPWATIAHAASMVGPGVTVHVAPGTYRGSTKTYTSGTSSARIVFISDTKWGSKLVGTRGSTWANHGNYVDIVDFDVTGPGLNGIYTEGDSTRIIGNHVHDMPIPCTSTGGSGINLNASNAEVEGNYVHDIGPYPTHCQYVHGIYFLKTGGHAYNNISFRNSGWGIHLWHSASNLIIANNTLFNNLSGGIIVGNNATIADHLVVNNNISYNNKQGIKEEGNTGTYNIYRNNLVFQNSSSNFSLQHGNTASGTVSADPQFVNFTGDSTGDYHLQAGSPAIDAGTSENAPTADFDGVRRPQGTAWDIGAYEYITSSLRSSFLKVGLLPNP
ncbi:MAG: right-handed parallel beta-helix repeat-containing protein [Acidobacteriia bacterium]|nr:right-handed parallel beta-helix repeat-containing protein [Terriglobia bacterium]